MSVRRRLLSALRKRFTERPLPLRLVFWDGEAFDFNDAPTVTLTLRKPQTAHDFLFGRFDRLGDVYVPGNIEVEGYIGTVLHTGVQLTERIGRAPWLAPLLRDAGLVRFRHSNAGDSRAIAHHYDGPDDFCLNLPRCRHDLFLHLFSQR